MIQVLPIDEEIPQKDHSELIKEKLWMAFYWSKIHWKKTNQEKSEGKLFLGLLYNSLLKSVAFKRAPIQATDFGQFSKGLQLYRSNSLPQLRIISCCNQIKGFFSSFSALREGSYVNMLHNESWTNHPGDPTNKG